MLVLSCKGDIFPLGFEHEVTFVVGVVAVSFALVYLNYPVAYLVQKYLSWVTMTNAPL